MKVRWTDASLRLRITPTELASLVLGTACTETLALPGGVSWAVTVRPGMATSALVPNGDSVELWVTPADLGRLVDGDCEGVYFATEDVHPMRFFIEKDFPCAHPHPVEAAEPETERFTPTRSYLERKHRVVAESA